MSYRNPKYTYISSQPAFSKMSDDIVKSAGDLADRTREAIEKEKKAGEKQWELGQGATQDYITNSLSSNNVGGEDTRGAVTRLFQGTGAKVGELTRLTRGPNPQCKTDGNCDELMLELGILNQGPEKVKNFITNLSSQLGTKDFRNFDKSQNSRAQQMGNILSGTNKMNPANGYTYDFKINEDGTSYDIIAKYDGDDKEGGFFNPIPAPGKYENSYVMNSAAMQDLQTNDGSVFIKTPNDGDLTNSVIQSSGVFVGATYDDKGVRKGGEYDINNFAKKDAEGNIITFAQTIGAGKDARSFNFGVIDEELIRTNKGFNNSIDEQLNNYVGDGGQDGEARTYWNMVLSRGATGNEFDEELASKVFNIGKADEDKFSVEELKTQWGEVMTNWSDHLPLSDAQKEIFKKVYREKRYSDIKLELERDEESRKVGVAVAPVLNTPILGTEGITAAGVE